MSRPQWIYTTQLDLQNPTMNNASSVYESTVDTAPSIFGLYILYLYWNFWLAKTGFHPSWGPLSDLMFSIFWSDTPWFFCLWGTMPIILISTFTQTLYRSIAGRQHFILSICICRCSTENSSNYVCCINSAQRHCRHSNEQGDQEGIPFLWISGVHGYIECFSLLTVRSHRRRS